MSLVLLLAVGAFSAVILTLAAVLLLRVADTDVAMAARFQAARGDWSPPAEVTGKDATAGAIVALQRGVSELGRLVMQSGVLPGRTRAELQQTLSAAGFRSASALPMFVGTKLSMLFGLPAAAWMLARDFGFEGPVEYGMIGVAAIMGLILPDMVIQRIRLRYLAKVEAGLSDALDLMVICAQAGLSLEPAMARVAEELRGVHKEMCLELEMTVRELEMMADSAMALFNLSQRTGLESLARLASTLAQTMQYGTPLTDALRTLSNEMRTAALTRFEERAARLPVMLTMPMIVFILPTVFMIAGGPAGIQISRSLTSS
jgi:tight adherence protein C